MDSFERPPDLAIQLALEPLQSLVSHGLGSVERELKALRREANNVQAVKAELTQALSELAQVHALLTQRVTRLEGTVQGITAAAAVKPARETTAPALAPHREPTPVSKGPWIVAAVAAVVTAGVLGYALPRPGSGSVRYVAVPTATDGATAAPSEVPPPAAVVVAPAGGLRPSEARDEAAAGQPPIAAAEAAPAPTSLPPTSSATRAAAILPPAHVAAPVAAAPVAAVRTTASASTTAAEVAAAPPPAPAEATAPTSATAEPPPIAPAQAAAAAANACGPNLPCDLEQDPRIWTRVSAPLPSAPPAPAPSAAEVAAQNRAGWLDASLVTGLSPTDYCRADIEALPGDEFRLRDYGDCSLDCRVAFGASGDPESLERCAGLGVRQVGLDCADAKRGSAWFRICRSAYLSVDGEAIQIRVSKKLARAID